MLWAFIFFNFHVVTTLVSTAPLLINGISFSHHTASVELEEALHFPHTILKIGIFIWFFLHLNYFIFSSFVSSSLCRPNGSWTPLCRYSAWAISSSSSNHPQFLSIFLTFNHTLKKRKSETKTQNWKINLFEQSIFYLFPSIRLIQFPFHPSNRSHFELIPDWSIRSKDWYCLITYLYENGRFLNNLWCRWKINPLFLFPSTYIAHWDNSFSCCH